MKKNTIIYISGLLLAAAALLPAVLPLGRMEQTPQTPPTQPTAQTTQTTAPQPTTPATPATDNGPQALAAILNAAEEAEAAAEEEAVAAEEKGSEEETPQHPLTLKADPEGTRFGPWY